MKDWEDLSRREKFVIDVLSTFAIAFIAIMAYEVLI